MFEDATFESMGTIHTRSRNWMLATFGLNASFLVALVAIPLFHPSGLPQMVYIDPLIAPASVEENPPVARQEHTSALQTMMPVAVLQAPPRTSRGTGILPHDGASDARGSNGHGRFQPRNFSGQRMRSVQLQRRETIVRQAEQPIRQVSRGVMEGMLVHKVIPTYPAIGRAVRAQGTVQLQATISREGTIENLRAVSGPQLLQQAAIDAVKQWRYRPYLLNGEPVEVETTINVDFTMN